MIGIHKYRKPEIINNFLTYGISSSKKTLRNLSLHANDSSMLIDKYLPGISEAMTCVEDTVELSYWTIRQKEFEQIVSAASECKVVKFKFCKLDIRKECTFDIMKTSQLQKIDFDSSGGKNYSNWAMKGVKQLSYIIKGLAKVETIKTKGIEIGLSCCGLKKEKVEAVVLENEMYKVEVTGI